MINKLKNLSIAVKFTLLILSVTLFFFSANIAVIYSRVSGLLRDTAGEDQQKMASLMASAVAGAMDEKIESVRSAALKGYASPAQGMDVSIGDFTTDKSSGDWALPVSINMTDSAGKPLDTYNALLEIDLFFKPLKDFKFGQTGRAVLVDDKTYLLFAQGVKPFIAKFCSYNELQKAVESRKKWLLMSNVHGQEGKILASFSVIEHPLLLKKGIVWRVFVVRGEKEVFAPLVNLVNRLVMTGCVLIILLALAGFVLGGLFVKPVRELRDGMERIGRGDLGYRIKRESTDEIGRLADSFNEMSKGLKEKTTLIANLDKEIENRKRAEERTRQLAEEWQKTFDSLKGAMSGVKQDTLDKVGNLVDATKIEADKIKLTLATIDIKDLVKKAVFVFEPKIREKGLDLKLDMPREKVNIEVDPERIKQVLEILVNNSLKFTHKGYIAISIKESKEEVECSVADTGTSIPKEEIPKLFDGFRHLSFSIAKGIIDKHNGKIWIESDPSKLTKVTFKLPRLV